jgi:hypothetical protein
MEFPVLTNAVFRIGHSIPALGQGPLFSQMVAWVVMLLDLAFRPVPLLDTGIILHCIAV